MVSICRTLYDAKIVSIGYTTSMVAVEIRVPSRGMRQTDVHMVSEMSEREIIVKEWHDDKGLIHRREVGQELVRCKECKYYEAKEDWCYWRDEAITADDFCSYGEREGE